MAYAFATAPDYEVQLSAFDQAIRVFAYVTCPIIAVGARFYWIPPVNAASYAGRIRFGINPQEFKPADCQRTGPLASISANSLQ